MFAVVVTLEANPGKAEELMAALEDNAIHTRQESECLKWEWSRHISEPNQFAIYELYTTPEAFAAHKASDHFAHWKEVSTPLIASKNAGQYDVVGPDER